MEKKPQRTPYQPNEKYNTENEISQDDGNGNGNDKLAMAMDFDGEETTP